MSYNYERDLVKSFHNQNLAIFNKYELLISKKEVPVSECIPDLIFIGVNNYPESSWFKKRLSSKHHYIIWLLKKMGDLDVPSLAEMSYMRASKISTLVQELIKADYIKDQQNGYYALSQRYASIEAKVIAVEAKLRNWKQALSQAIRYSQFADLVMVAMDSDSVLGRVNIIEEYKAHNIGLCAVSSDETQWLVTPIERCTLSFEKEYLIASAIAFSNQTLWSCRYLAKASAQALI
jgi:DNA-binding MarR family transcriptional regulator